MSLVTCKDCGNQLSHKATSCPKCGSPQKKSKVWILALIIILVIGSVGVVYLFPHDDRAEKITLAKEILRSNKDDIIELTTKKVDNSLAKFAINIATDLSCNCLIDSLSIKLADKHTLNELKDIQVQPINNITEISNLIIENEEICKKCLTFQN